MTSRVQVQTSSSGGDEWVAAGGIAILPDGTVEFTDVPVVQEILREDFFSPDADALYSIKDGGKYLEALTKWSGNMMRRVLDMDDPAVEEFLMDEEEEIPVRRLSLAEIPSAL